MKKFLLFGIFLSLLFQGTVLAQRRASPNSNYGNNYRKTDFGIGIGIDYGGIGAKAVFCPIPNLGLFFGAGFQLGGIGWQLGANGYLLPKTKTNMARPYAKIMYGVNAASYVDGAPEYKANFTGASIGFGTELRFGANRSNGLNIDINVPFRSQEYDDMLETIKNDPRVTGLKEPYLITISIGYHWEF